MDTASADSLTPTPPRAGEEEVAQPISFTRMVKEVDVTQEAIPSANPTKPSPLPQPETKELMDEELEA